MYIIIINTYIYIIVSLLLIIIQYYSIYIYCQMSPFDHHKLSLESASSLLFDGNDCINCIMMYNAEYIKHVETTKQSSYSS